MPTVKMTTEQFIASARELHGNQYTYDNSVYVDRSTPISITCPTHGEFLLTMHSHVYRKCGCKQCGDAKKRKSLYTKPQLIDMSVAVHGEKYSYDQIEFNQHPSMKIKVPIECPNHGTFMQSFSSHIYARSGCPHCGAWSAAAKRQLSIPKTEQKFIADALATHGDQYTYEHVQYVNSHTPVTITCPTHGDFIKRPVKHLSSQEGCPGCSATDRIQRTTRFKSFDEVIADANQIHEHEYQYTAILQDNDHIATTDRLLINCPIHGQFTQTINKHVYQRTGCRQCFTERNARTRSKTTEQFIKDSIRTHGKRYSYDSVDYRGAHQHVLITCPDHGLFSISPANHVLKQQGCNVCASSGPELIIRQWCIDNNIRYIQQYKPDGCVSPTTGAQLRFDFFLPDNNLLIEYDGIYHYQPIDHGTGTSVEDFHAGQHRDRTKTEYAKKNGIPLLRIPFFEKQSLSALLEQAISSNTRGNQ